MVLQVRRNREREGERGYCFNSGGIQRGLKREDNVLSQAEWREGRRELVGENWLQIICGAPTTLTVKGLRRRRRKERMVL